MAPSRFQAVIPRLPVADLQRTIDFYSRVLEFELSVLFPESNPYFCLLDRDTISLGFFSSHAVGETCTIGTGELYLAVEDVRAVHEVLRVRWRIEWGPEVYLYGRREFAIRDPDGYLLIFTEPTDDPPTCLNE